jgi:hypothetical protein
VGAFLLALGVIGLATVRRPWSHPGVVVGFAVLLAIRAAQRLYLRGEIEAGFGVAGARLAVHGVFFGCLSLSLLALLFLAREKRA